MKKKKLRWLGKFYVCLFVIAVCMALLTEARYYRHYKWVKNNDIVVYDLTWPDEEDDGSVVFRKWRYFIETKTKLPRKIEKYSKYEPNGEYALQETLIVNYPTDEQIRQVIEDANF